MDRKKSALRRFTSRCCLLAVVCGLACCDSKPLPATPVEDSPGPEGVSLIVNARIHTFDESGTVYDPGALAFSKAGRILAVGETESVQRAYPGAARMDRSGSTVLPGLIDAHGHLYGLARSDSQAKLAGTKSKREVLERLREFAAGLPAEDWLVGAGWDQNDWPERKFPTREDLDSVFPDRPVWLTRIDGHAGWANSEAISRVNRDLTGNWQPDGGRIHRGPNGHPSGVFIDAAMGLIESSVPPPSPERLSSALETATRRLAALGITTVHDAGVDREAIELYRRKVADGSLYVRVYAMADGIGAAQNWLCESGPYSDPAGRLTVRSVKLYADGALGSRGAALLEEYRDDPGNRGLLFFSTPELEGAMREILSCGLQVAVHAIGDAANRQVLDAFEQLLPAFPDNPGRHRIEHAQVIHPDDIPRFAELGIFASMQPSHATSDMYWAANRLGRDRLEGAYAWRTLFENGTQLAFGSDFPVEEANPMLGIYAAVGRRDLEGWPPGGWLPGERLSREVAIRAFTTGAARAGFMESQIGSLERGKRADFIVLDRDPMAVEVAEIPYLNLLATWLDGRRVHPHEKNNTAEDSN